MALDRVQPLKIEGSDTGGTDEDLFPTGANRNEDFLDCRGITVQNDSSDDEVTVVSRDASDNMTFKDGANATSVTLTDLVAGTGGITEASHKVLKDLIHFIDDGPGDGWASGSFKETLPTADPFPTQEIWWTTTGKTHKIVSLDTTRNVNKTPATEVWKIYAADGSTVLVTVTDTIAYSGVFETTRTRTWA